MSHGGEKGTQNGVARILGYQVLFLGRLPGDHFTIMFIVSASLSFFPPAPPAYSSSAPVTTKRVIRPTAEICLNYNLVDYLILSFGTVRHMLYNGYIRTSPASKQVVISTPSEH